VNVSLELRQLVQISRPIHIDSHEFNAVGVQACKHLGERRECLPGCPFIVFWMPASLPADPALRKQLFQCLYAGVRDLRTMQSQ
jgi:hypothetical protein